MKKIIISFLLCLSAFAVKSQIVATAVTQQFLGKNFGYIITLKNTGDKPVDAVSWTAEFTDNFGRVRGVREGEWQSGNILHPIKPGGSTEDVERVWIDGATKVKITIKEVHTTN